MHELRCRFEHDQMKMKIAETTCEEEEAQDRSFRNTSVEDKEEATRKIGKQLTDTEQLRGKSKKPSLRDKKREFQEGENRQECQMQVNREQIDTIGLSNLKYIDDFGKGKFNGMMGVITKSQQVERGK